MTTKEAMAIVMEQVSNNHVEKNLTDTKFWGIVYQALVDRRVAEIKEEIKCLECELNEADPYYKRAIENMTRAIDTLVDELRCYE